MKSTTPVPLFKRLSLLRRGYHGNVYDLYNLQDYPLEEYFSDWEKAKMSMMYDGRNVRGGYQYGLNNKIFSTAILGQYLRVPKVYAVIEHGRTLFLNDEMKKMFAGSWLDVCNLVGGKLVFKPVAEGCARGIFFMSSSSGKLMVNGVPQTASEVEKKISSLDEYILVEYLHQSQYAAALFPEVTNTIRMVTLIEPDTNRPYLAIAVQRIGRKSSYPVDNRSRGGLCAEIDLATGVLGRAGSQETDQRRLVWHDVHPDTGAQIKGVRVPRWQEIKGAIIKAASCMSYYKFLSWDVVTMDDGIAVIEADTVSGLPALQMHRPLLRDEKVRRCLEHLGCVGKRP